MESFQHSNPKDKEAQINQELYFSCIAHEGAHIHAQVHTNYTLTYTYSHKYGATGFVQSSGNRSIRIHHMFKLEPLITFLTSQ